MSKRPLGQGMRDQLEKQRCLSLSVAELIKDTLSILKFLRGFFFCLFLAKIDSKRVASNLAERKDLQKDLILYSSKAVQNEGLL